MDALIVAVVSPPIGTGPETISYVFVFEEVYRLAKRGLAVHVLRELARSRDLALMN